MDIVTAADRARLESIIAAMEHGWNTGDGARFAEPFALDGDQVNIIGGVMKGRKEIAARHDRIFKTTYLDSRNSLRLIEARYVVADVILARVHSLLSVPHGPRQGQIEALMTLVFRQTNVRWEVVTLHNTRITPPA
jgi:uncharacterized protein (TIGR02246 family)